MIAVISVTLFFLVLRFSVTVFNFISNPKLTRVSRLYTDKVSILIPARNELDNIIPLLESIQQQKYQNYEVIIYDDNSSDDTYTLCSAFVATHPRFTVIKGGEPPDGWLGKSYACSQLARHATGQYFLFLDANVRLTDDFINSAVHRMHIYTLGLLSLFPNQVMHTIGEKTTVPLLHYMLLNLLPLRLIYLVKNDLIAIASGQCMLFDAAIYRQNLWHSKVKNKVLAETQIMKQVKAAGHNGEVLLANGMLDSRMYWGYTDAITGFSKNLLPAFNYGIPALFIYILLLAAGPMVILMTLNLNLIFFMVGLIMLTRVMTSLSAGQNAGENLVLHPLQMINLVIIAFLSVQKHLTGNLIWKGRGI